MTQFVAKDKELSSENQNCEKLVSAPELASFQCDQWLVIQMEFFKKTLLGIKPRADSFC